MCPTTFPADTDPLTDEPALLDARTVARLLSCSTRHLYRLSTAGRMPSPVRLGALTRWSRSDILDWIADGCPSVCTKGGR